jgi:hypothetical protein
MAKINLAQESSTPSNPASGQNRLYFKGDDKLYKLGSGGTEEEVGTGAGGGGDVTPYRLAVSVASNNITVALKDKDGNDPSVSSPVKVQIGDTVREVTAALSVTANAGTNWCNAGSDELKTKEVDYFVYLGYNTTDGVVIGFSRIPFARIYSDFSATNTNEKFCRISTITNAAAGDPYIVIGRFAATLSAGAGYTWTVPTFTNANLKHAPIYATRQLEFTPQPSGGSPLTWTGTTVEYAKYSIENRNLYYAMRVSGTLGGSAGVVVYVTLPFSSAMALLAAAAPAGWGNVATVTAKTYVVTGTPRTITVQKYDNSNFATSGTMVASLGGLLEI